MTCLSDIELQRAIDGEADEAAVAHLAACARCRGRADARRRDLDALAAAVDGIDMPAASSIRIRTAIAGRDAAVRGATTLRASPSRRWWPYAGAVAAAAAGVLLAVGLVLPRVGAPTTLSAAEVLRRSLQTLSAAHGIELLEYDLTIGGAGHESHRIVQLVDYDHPDRFRLSNYGPDGALQSALSQDPFTGTRTHLVRVDGRNYVFTFAAPESALLPIPELAQAQLEAVIAMMQTTADQKLTVVDGGRQYVIQIPPVTPHDGAGMLDLNQARAVIDGSDFRVREFEASGAFLKQPYTVSFRLERRTAIDPSQVSGTDFAIEPQPGDVVLRGTGTTDLFGDVVGTALRELARAHQR